MSWDVAEAESAADDRQIGYGVGPSMRGGCRGRLVDRTPGGLCELVDGSLGCLERRQILVCGSRGWHRSRGVRLIFRLGGTQGGHGRVRRQREIFFW